MSGVKNGILAGIGRGGKKVNPYAGQSLTVVSGSTTATGTILQFSLPASFVDHTGVSFVNVTTAEETSIVSSATVSPSDVIAYDVTWVTAPVAGDVIEWHYDPTAGNYRNAFAPIQENLMPGTIEFGTNWTDQGDGVYFHIGTIFSAITFLTDDGILIEGELYDIEFNFPFATSLAFTLGGASINGNFITPTGPAFITASLFAENIAQIDAAIFQAASTLRIEEIAIRRSNNLKALLLQLSNHLDV